MDSAVTHPWERDSVCKFLKMIYEQRIQSKSGLEHITVVEEARNVAPARRRRTRGAWEKG